MAYERDAKPEAHFKHQESVFLFGLVRVKELMSVLIEEDGLGFFEGYPVFSLILLVLVFIPGETNLGHVCILYI